MMGLDSDDIITIIIVIIITIIFYKKHIIESSVHNDVFVNNSDIININDIETTYTTIFSFHPKIYNLGKGYILLTVKGTDNNNPLKFRVVDERGKKLSKNVIVNSMFQKRIEFDVIDDRINVELQYKWSNPFPNEIIDFSILKLELEYFCDKNNKLFHNFI